MQILQKEKRAHYLRMYPVAPLFSFDVEKFIQVHEYDRGEWIIQEGQQPDYLFYVIEGKAKIYITHQNGKVSLLSFINQADYIGEMELLHETYYSKGVQTTTKTICFAIPLQSWRDKLLEDVKFLRHLSIQLSEKATMMSMKYSQSLAFPLENRLADFILQTADDDLYKEKHVTVCDFLGVSYRHLLHVFAQFVEKGYLQKERYAYRVINKHALDQLAGMLRNG